MKEVTLYLHSTKERMLTIGEGMGLSGEALDRFKYAASEVKFTLLVDEVSGNAEIIKVDDRTVRSAQ
jgi:hypothetical protein